METEKKITIKIKLNKEEVKDIVLTHLMRNEQALKVESQKIKMENVLIQDIKRTAVEQGGDIHDADYIQYFDGIELIIQI